MSKSHNPKLVCLLASSVILSFTAAAGQTATPKVVSLTSDACAQVTDGNIVTFEWNPAFGSSASGLQNFEMSFVLESEASHPARSSGHLLLSAMAHGSQRAPLSPAITAEPNGFYLMRFWVNSASLPPGTYTLLSANATPVLAPSLRGAALASAAPSMTNSPTRYPYCIVVSAAAGTRRMPQ